MAGESYVLVVRETSSHDGIDADIVDEDGLVETTTQIAYAEHDVSVAREEDGPERIETTFTTDAGALDLRSRRADGRFEFQALADDETAASITVTDREWNL
jgi:hypothetical protein